MRPNETAAADPVEDIDLVLVETLEKVAAGDRDALESACRAHPRLATELRERFEALREMKLLPNDSAAMAFPERLGDFRLVRRLGGGGMGVVYEAQETPSGRVVALKLVRPEHLYFPRAIERFRRETEAVSRLSHPGIVALYSVGEANGSPYIAMELLEGATLSQALEQFHGVTPESLAGRDLRAAAMARSRNPIDDGDPSSPELFAGSWVDACLRVVLRISEAVAHAHERGILHRDIKPSNVMVTPEGRAVLLDFGLAGLEGESRMTITGATLGSVPYMAPEQVAGRAQDIDARTDVYALGVTLYELLALQPPYSGSDAEQTRAAILDGQPASIRARNREVTREVETVVFKALDRERGRRYATMQAFGDDLRALLEGRPVSARPPSAAYRAWRWIRRHPTISTAAAAALAIAVVGPLGLYLGERRQKRALQAALLAESQALATAAAERERADHEATEAEAVSNYLVALFGGADPYRTGSRDVRASDLLAMGLRQVETELAGKPELQARLLERIGESYTNLERYNEAAPALERALELRRDLSGQDSLATARCMVLLGSARRLAGKAEYLPLFLEALEVFERAGPSHVVQVAQCHSMLAISQLDSGRLDEAAEHLRLTEDALDRMDQPSRATRWGLLTMLATGYQRLRQFDKAEALARRALAQDESSDVPVAPHAFHAAALDMLGSSLRMQARYEEALEVYGRLAPYSERLYGRSNPLFCMHQLSYALVLRDVGRSDEAIEILEPTLETISAQLGGANPMTLKVVRSLALTLAGRGRFGEALERLDETLERARQSAGEADPANAALWTTIAQVRLAAGDAQGAHEAAREALDTVTPANRGETCALLALASLRAGARWESVESWAREALPSHSPSARVDACFALAGVALAKGARNDAETWAAKALEEDDIAARSEWTYTACELLQAEFEIQRGEAAGCARAQAALQRLARVLHASHAEFRRALDRLAFARETCPAIGAELERASRDANGR